MQRLCLLRGRRLEMAHKNFVVLLALLMTTPAISMLKPKQPDGEIVNPSIEILDKNIRPDHWILEPAPRGVAAPGGQSTSEMAHAGASTQDSCLEIIGKGRGKFLVGPPSLMPENNLRDMRQDTLALLRQLDAPICGLKRNGLGFHIKH
jgi:hypothetical protein